MSEARPRRRIALLLEYDGRPFGGSQIQKRHPSIQAELERSIHELTGEQLRVAFAGRTDAGVHALGQVAVFDTGSRHSPDVFVRGLNAKLPDEIAVQAAQEVDPGFDPRRHATGRTYRYLIYNEPLRSPIWRTSAWHVAEALDVAAMGDASALLVGEHDFAAFSRREGVSTVRCVRRCDVERRGPLIAIEMEANAFLRHQVRRTAGTLVEAGRGKLIAADVRSLLERTEPATAGPVAPAHGLCLLRVTHPGLALRPRDALL